MTRREQLKISGVIKSRTWGKNTVEETGELKVE